jgi:hypothetical protein
MYLSRDEMMAMLEFVNAITSTEVIPKPASRPMYLHIAKSADQR